MKKYEPVAPISAKATDAFAAEGLAFKFDASGDAALCGANEGADGVMQLIIADGEYGAAQIIPGSIVPARAGGTFSNGALLTTNASSKFVVAASTNTVSAIARGAGVADTLTLVQILGRSGWYAAP